MFNLYNFYKLNIMKMSGTCRDTYNNYGSYLKFRGTDKAVCELNSKIIKNTNAIESFVTRATNAEGINGADIATNKADIATNKADIATNKNDIATNKNDIATNKNDIATNNTDLTRDKASLSGATFTGDVIMKKNLNINGDLTISGTTTTVNTQNLDISDNLISLNYGYHDTPSTDSGILIMRGGSEHNAFMGWDEIKDRFVFGTTEASSNATGHLDIDIGTIEAHLDGTATTAKNYTSDGDIADSLEILTDAVAKNTAKVGYTEDLVAANSAVALNSAKVGITEDQAAAIKLIANLPKSTTYISIGQLWNDNGTLKVKT
jgi:hypothetical protein